MDQYTGGCLELNIPFVILDSCQHLEDGQTVEMHGSNIKQGTRKVKNSVKIFAQKKNEMLSLSLFASAMGDVFQKKLTQTWHCEVNMAEIPPSEGIAVKTEHVETADLSLVVERGGEADTALSEIVPQSLSELTASLGLDVDSADGQENKHIVDTLTTQRVEDGTAVTSVELEEVELKDTGLEGTELIDMEVGDADPGDHNEEDEEEVMEEEGGESEEEVSEKNCKAEDNKTSKKTTSRAGTRNNKTKVSSQMKTRLKSSRERKTQQGKGNRKRYAPKDAKVEDLVCTFCNRSWFNTVAMYNKHMRSCVKNPEAVEKAEEAEEMYTCDVCFLTTPSLGHLKRHRKAIHNIGSRKASQGPRKVERGSYSCEFCGRVFPYRTSVIYHARHRCSSNPAVQKAMFCRYCSRTFTSVSDLDHHIFTVHPKGLQLQCDTCGKVFASRGGLYVHTIKHHNTQGKAKRFKCDICDMAFFTTKDMEQHKIKHSDERRFVCEICGKRYKYDHHVKRHMATFHENRYPYQCEKCGHGVEKLSYLNSHICGRVRRSKPEKHEKKDILDPLKKESPHNKTAENIPTEKTMNNDMIPLETKEQTYVIQEVDVSGNEGTEYFLINVY